MRFIPTIALALACAALAPSPAPANWLTKIVREAGEVGGKAGKVGLDAVEHAAAHLKLLPKVENGAALAAHATPEGHWQFVNRAGEIYTAGTPAEMSRFVATLAPEAQSGRLSLYITEDTVFTQRALLKDLPKDAELHLVVGKDAFKLRRPVSDGKLYAEVRPNVIAEAGEQAAFREAVFQLGRPLDKSNIRVLSLEPGGPAALSSAPRIDPANKIAEVDRIDPAKLADALHSIRGQTAIVSARIDGTYLRFKPSSGAEQTLPLRTLTEAAEAADVNLVILQSNAPRQPGGRNWLWQRVEVSGLGAALQRATFADFLDALGASLGELSVAATPQGTTRTILRATPTGSSAAPGSNSISNWLGEIAGEITGNVVTNTVELYATSKDRQDELDLRLIPYLPSVVQILYLASIVFAVIGWPVTRAWWERLWPSEKRADYAGATGYFAARAARLVTFVVIFMPLVGYPALLWSLVLQIWWWITAPVRFLRWLAGRMRPQTG